MMAAMSTTTNITVYGIANCDSVKKARAWLTAQGLPYQFHDFKKQGVPAEHLATWLAAVGWERLLNRQGTTWRKLDPALQSKVCDAASASALLLEHSSAIKRPVVEWQRGDSLVITVGFDALQWAQQQA
jgi:Spx/MgsR family transcriptional regulator